MSDRKAHFEQGYIIKAYYDVNRGLDNDESNISRDATDFLNLFNNSLNNNNTIDHFLRKMSDYINSEIYLSRFKHEILGLGVYGVGVINLNQSANYIRYKNNPRYGIRYNAYFEVITSSIYILEYLPNNSIAYCTEKNKQVRFTTLDFYRKCIIDN